MICNHKAIGCILFFTSQVLATCFAPEPDRRICYNVAGATPQKLDLKEVEYMAKYLRFYGNQKNNPAFYTMKVADADNCAEWLVTSKGGSMVLAKLVGDQDTSVTFNDIANTIDGGSNHQQMGVIVNTTDPLYRRKDYVTDGFTNRGIILKIVHNPDVRS